MEERMEYRLEERMRDVQDLLENCQTRVSDTPFDFVHCDSGYLVFYFTVFNVEA